MLKIDVNSLGIKEEGKVVNLYSF